MRLAFELQASVKQTALCTVGMHYSICWGPEQKKKQTKKQTNKKKTEEVRFVSSLPVCWAGSSVISCPHTRIYTIRNPGSQAFGLNWNLYQQLAFLGLQLADGRSWDLSASIITWVIYPTGSISLENPKRTSLFVPANNPLYVHGSPICLAEGKLLSYCLYNKDHNNKNNNIDQI